MSNEITMIGTTGATYYVVVRTGTTAWDGDSFETETSSRDSFDLPLAETPTNSGRFVATFPSTIVAGEYSITIYRQLGSSPAISDLPVGHEDTYWDTSNLSKVVTTDTASREASKANVSLLATAAALATAKGVIDTIQAKTTNLPASPAATGDIPSATIAASKTILDKLDSTIEEDT